MAGRIVRTNLNHSKSQKSKKKPRIWFFKNLNNQRADDARVAVEAFMKANGCDAEYAVGDLIVNLLHLARRESYGFFDAETLLEKSLSGFEEEVAEEAND
jgi:hypothetical protein